MALKKIRLELARAEEFPAGSAEHGYEFAAPLDKNARIDAKEWHSRRNRCRVLRFWGDADHLPYRSLMRQLLPCRQANPSSSTARPARALPPTRFVWRER